MNEFRKKLYNTWREENKDDPAKAVGWRNMDALDARFNCTLSHLSHKNFDGVSILDVGCGASLNLLRYLPDQYYTYLGIDCNEESLKHASKEWDIPFNKNIQFDQDEQLVLDEHLSLSSNKRFDVIISQGIYQEFDNIKSIKDHVLKLSTMLNSGGELLIMTPANRVLDAEGRSVLKISAYDAVSILEDTGLPYELFLGELGEHIIMRVYRKD